MQELIMYDKLQSLSNTSEHYAKIIFTNRTFAKHIY